MIENMGMRSLIWKSTGKVVALYGKLCKMTPETLAKFVDHATTCLVGSVDEEGFPQTRAMLAVRHRDGIREFYLTTNTSSAKVKQFQVNEKASLYFYDPVRFVGVLFI